mmetsp:Transcript_21647/g.52276  ORF Transcript_21647/g.52276 Transcript_21647/m.52276 type:complete len:250 (+) Transcript_21647:1336-2085(+)
MRNVRGCGRRHVGLRRHVPRQTKLDRVLELEPAPHLRYLLAGVVPHVRAPIQLGIPPPVVAAEAVAVAVQHHEPVTRIAGHVHRLLHDLVPVPFRLPVPHLTLRDDLLAVLHLEDEARLDRVTVQLDLERDRLSPTPRERDHVRHGRAAVHRGRVRADVAYRTPYPIVAPREPGHDGGISWIDAAVPPAEYAVDLVVVGGLAELYGRPSRVAVANAPIVRSGCRRGAHHVVVHVIPKGHRRLVPRVRIP